MTYSGVLVDSTTGAPVADSTVSIVLPGQDPAGVAVTGANGQFVFDFAPADFVVAFSKIGYYPISYNSAAMSATPGVTLEINPGSAETLPAVTVKPVVKWILGSAAIGLLLYYAQSSKK